MKIYTIGHLVKTNPNKPNSKPIPKMPKMNLSPYNTKDYNNETASGSEKNKPDSNPIQTQSKPILEGMNVSFCATGYYKIKSRIVYNIVVPVTAERISINWAKENPPSKSEG